MEYILASASPRRKELLRYLIPKFTVSPTDSDESLPKSIGGADAVEVLSERKAKACAKNHPDAVVIGCDTVVELDGEILGKPRDESDARRMLSLLSGKTHRVYTGVCISFQNLEHTFHVCTEVTFMVLTEKQMTDYLATGEPFDKAGAYGIQGYGCTLVQRINGCYYNVMGLPVAALGEQMRKLSLL